MSAQETLLAVHSLTLSTLDNKQLVKQASFTVDRAEIVALVGESGSGKH